MTPSRTLLALALLLLTAPVRAGWWDDAWLDPALLEAHSQEGGSGFIHVPAAQALPNGLLTGAIHRYRVKIGRGFPYGIEAGGQIELEGWKMDEAEKRNLLYLRWAPIDARRYGVGLAMGAESVGFEDLGFKTLGFLPTQALEGLDRLYVVAGGLLPHLPMAYAAVGYAGGAVAPSAPMAVLVFSPFPGLAGMAEYEGNFTHVGIRLLLSTQIKLDLALSRLQAIDPQKPFANVLENNLRFGVSYSEEWP